MTDFDFKVYADTLSDATDKAIVIVANLLEITPDEVDRAGLTVDMKAEEYWQTGEVAVWIGRCNYRIGGLL